MRICNGRIYQAVSKQITGILGALFIWIISGVIASGSQDVSLQWNPNSDTNVAGYALYIGTNSGDYPSRIDVGTNTIATLAGLSNGLTCYFVATAYDSAGVESTPSNETNFVAPINNPPTLNPLSSNYNIAPLSLLVISNTASDSLKNDALTFSLDAGAPTNMFIDTNSGVLEWIPPLTAGGTTNSVTVRVTDSSVPPQSSIQTFTVTVSNYVQISFGSSIIPMGQTNSVALVLNSSTGVTNVSFILDVPGNRMTNLSVTSLAPSIATVSQSTNGAARSIVTFKAAAGQVLQGPLTVAQLNYKAVTNASLPSCFAALHATSITGVQSNGTPVVYSVAGLGKAVLIGAQALTQSCLGTNGQHNVVVYGSAGTNYQMQSRIGLTGTWTNEANPAMVMPTNLSVTFSNFTPISGKYYRAHAM